MIGVITSLFNNKKVIENGLDIIDNSFFTEQEKKKMSKDLLLSHAEIVKEGMKDNNYTRSITRRLIALLLIIPYVLSILTCGILIIISSDKLKDMLELIGLLNIPVLAVVAFYFGGHMLGIKKVK